MINVVVDKLTDNPCGTRSPNYWTLPFQMNVWPHWFCAWLQ